MFVLRLTAKRTANIADNGDRWRTSADYWQRILIFGERSRTLADIRKRGLQNRLRGAAEASWVGSIPIHPRQI